MRFSENELRFFLVRTPLQEATLVEDHTIIHNTQHTHINHLESFKNVLSFVLRNVPRNHQVQLQVEVDRIFLHENAPDQSKPPLLL